MAITTNGATFTYNSEVIGELVSISGPSVSVATIDTTTLDDVHRTFVGGTIDGGEISIEVLMTQWGPTRRNLRTNGTLQQQQPQQLKLA